MALFLSSKLRKAADTSLLEGRKNQLLNDHEEFIAFDQSEELQNYIELEREINSEDFKQNKKEIEDKKFKGSRLEMQEKKLKYLLKSKRYRVYSSVHEGSDRTIYLLGFLVARQREHAVAADILLRGPF